VEVQRHSFLNSALDNSVVSFRPRLLCHSGKSSLYPFDRRMGVPPEPVWVLRYRNRPLSPSRNRTTISRMSSPWLCHYTVYITLALFAVSITTHTIARCKTGVEIYLANGDVKLQNCDRVRPTS